MPRPAVRTTTSATTTITSRPGITIVRRASHKARRPFQSNSSCMGPLIHRLRAMRQADQHVALGALIETRRGVDNAAAICAVPGLNFVFIGAGDLALSLGDADSAALASHCARVRDTAHANGLTCGLFTGNAQAARQALDDGYDMVVVANDIELATSGFSQAMATSRGEADA